MNIKAQRKARTIIQGILHDVSTVIVVVSIIIGLILIIGVIIPSEPYFNCAQSSQIETYAPFAPIVQPTSFVPSLTS